MYNLGRIDPSNVMIFYHAVSDLLKITRKNARVLTKY